MAGKKKNTEETPKKQIVLRVDPELRAKLKQYSISKGRHMGDILIEWIETTLKSQPEWKQLSKLPYTPEEGS